MSVLFSIDFIADAPSSQQVCASIQYSPIRQRERTNSKRLSFTEQEPKGGIYESVQNSDMSERNDSASSVASFADVQQSNGKVMCKNTPQCKVCSRNFRSFKTLNQHLRLHMSQSYKCNTCGKIFSRKKSYLRHIKSHKSKKADRLFECGICDKSFVDLSSWKRHRMCHMDVRKYSCNLCGRAFNEKYSLKVHQTSHFYSSLRADKHSDIDSKFSCHICGKILKSRTAVKNHMLTHSAKKFTCEFCTKRFSQKFSYVRHRRIHTGEKPYKCGECEKSFSDGSAWSKHIKTHTGIKPYPCHVCSKSFYDKTLCKTHMKTHQGRKSYKQADENKESFKMLTEGMRTRVSSESYKGSASDLHFEMDNTDNLYSEDVNLHLGISDKESDDSQLIDTGFAADLLPTEEDRNFTNEDKSPDKKVSDIIDNFVLDEKFQSEFVERNLPSKPIESDNELISTAFPEDSDILGEETEAEMQHSEHSNPIFTTAKPDTRLVGTEKQEDMWHKKSRQKRSVRGKVFPESPAKCKICHKKFKQESLLKQHLQFHCMSKLYKCRYCGKQLSTKHSLIRHERIHIGDRPYQCYICQKTFADNYGCIRHINTHFGKEPKGPTKQVTRSSYKSSEEDFTYEGNSEYRSPSRSFVSVTSGAKFSQQKVADTCVKPGRKCETQTYTDMVQSDGAALSQPKLNADASTAVSKPEQSVNLSNNNSSIIVKENTNGEVKVLDRQVEKKHLYKCFKCAQLFVSKELCIDHITQTCSKQELSATELVVSQSIPGQDVGVLDPSSTTLITSNLTQSSAVAKNLFQCSLCLLMFEDQGACERHIADKCEKLKVDEECAVQSILEEPFSEPEYKTLPELPFPEVSCSNNYLEMDDILLVPNSSVSSDRLVGTSANLLSDDNKKAGSNLTSQSSVPLSFIPYCQISSQTSPGVKLSPGLQSTVQLSSDSKFTAILQKPIVNVGSSKFIIANQSINFVGQSSTDSVVKTTGQTKKKHGEKTAEDDLQERTCTICSKVFTTKHILKQHTLIHMEKKYECKYCMKKFHNKYGRDRHERIHTGEKPFSCPYCKLAFGDNSTYKKHTRNCSSAK